MEFGISLTGGGARVSYQAGVLKGLIELLKEQSLLGEKNPFKLWTGVSAGAINASLCASSIHDLEAAGEKLVSLWGQVRPEDVYLTDAKSLGLNGIRWAADLTFGSLMKKKVARSLLDTEPLRGTLEKNIQFSDIQKHLDLGLLNGLACSAYSYRDNRTVTFLQSNLDCGWDRHRRYSLKQKIGADEVLASCAIPVLFPAAQIGDQYYADGSFRNLSPISPIIHMGAKKILVIGVRGKDEFSEKVYKRQPGVARIAGLILNSLFFDTTEVDLERLRHINELIDVTGKDIETKRSDYSRIEYLVVRPSRDVSYLAYEKIKNFPKMIHFLLGGLGPVEESSELASYLLFVSEFTRELIDLGYADIMSQKETVVRWLTEHL
jgi:NTE family protein